MKYLLTVFLMLIISGQVFSQYETHIVVAKDGSGDYTSIQEAIDNTKAFPDKRITISIKNGVYNEKVKVHSWNTNLSIIGESKEGTIITYDDHFDKIDRGRNSTFFTYTVLVEADNFYAENLTIQNTAGPVGQAVALHVEADKAKFYNCRFLGNQDTLYLAGAHSDQYFVDCYVEGTTDYIFGAATAVFENCLIHSKANSFITAASTPRGKDYGFVFIDCRLTANDDVDAVYLGRPWRSYAKTVFINCKIGDFIRPEGWDNWSSPEREKTVYYAEYNEEGLSEGRVNWSHQLSKKEAKQFSVKNIFDENDRSLGKWYQFSGKE